MKKLARNVYMGSNSIAKIPKVGKVDTFEEVMKNLYATAYDALNLVLLDNDFPGLIVNERLFKLVPFWDWDYNLHILSMFKVVNENRFFLTLKGRFDVLRRLAIRIRERQKRDYALAKINETEALIFSILQRFRNPILEGADAILKNEFLDVLDFAEMEEIERLITQAEVRLIKQMARGKLKLKRK